MRPQDLPEFRAQVVRRFEAANAELAEASRKANSESHPLLTKVERDLANATRGLRDTAYGPESLLRHWQFADLFFVTSEMVALAEQAVKTMPGFALHREDLPSEFGVIWLENATLGEGEHVISLWGPNYAGGISFATYAVRPDEVLLLHHVNIKYGENEPTNLRGTPDDLPAFRLWAPVIRCCWLLMQQRIAAVDMPKPDRASARRLARLGRQPEAVRVISLRHPEAHGVPRGDRSYHHRWVVRGHWRKQWYASQERHVPIWISPHVKGPDGAPLLAGEKVYAWTR